MNSNRSLLAAALLLLPSAAWAAGRAAPGTAAAVPDVDIVAAPPAATLDPALPEPTWGAGVPVDVRASIRDALRLPALKGSRVSVHAVRASDGAPVVSLNADELLNPASCVKLFTTSAALRTLRPQYRFATEYLARVPLEGTTLKGDLYVRGTGDPTITQERLYHVASELAARGLTTIQGDVVLDDTYFDHVGEPPGWEQETQADRSYAAPNGALSLTQNAIAVYVRPGDHRGAPGVVAVEPPSDMITVESQVITVAHGRRLWVRSVPEGDRTKVIVMGVIGVHEAAERFARRVTNPAMHFGGSLVQVLKMRGIQVKGKVRLGVTPESARALWTDLSVSLREIVTVLNHHSSNFVAEMLLKAVGAQVHGAPGTTEKGLRVVADMLERDVGVAPGSYIIGNGSGLNDVNRFSTTHVVRLLRMMNADTTVWPEFLTSLAVAGSRGTLSHRMKETAAEGKLRAKTGTLMGVSALSGVVNSPTMGPILFSVIINGLNGPAAGGWDMQDRIGMALAGQADASAYARRERPRDTETPGGGLP